MVWKYLGGLFGSVAGDPKDLLVEVRNVTRFLLLLGLIGLLSLFLFGIFGTEANAAAGFLVWSFVAAIGAALSGMALGMLFGLPTVRRVEIVSKSDGTANAATDKNAYLGYAESTNLEQVADWLTKIIIGLTLTQYGSWEAKLARLSYDLTVRLTGGCGGATSCGEVQYPAGSTIPGGFLLLFFSVLGFLLSYLWMRGYFISEMEAAKSIAVRKARQDELDQLKRDADKLRDDAVSARKDAADAQAQRDGAQAEAQQALADRDKVKEELSAAQARADIFQRQYEDALQHGRAQSKDNADPDAAKSMADLAVAKAPQEAKGEAVALAEQSLSPKNPDDPWLGQFGGSDRVDGLTLSAVVTPTANNPDYFDIKLVIVADEKRQKAKPVQSAQYYLHPTFGNAPRTVSFNAEGRAPLELIGYGAFTVGVLVDDGTKLELNLAKLQGVDERFLSR